MLKKLALLLIKLYQKTLSPDHGPLRFVLRRGVCIYQPTCSDYTYQAIEKFGITKGVWLGIKRLMRCHPWHEGGDDPIINPNIKILNPKQYPNSNIQNNKPF